MRVFCGVAVRAFNRKDRKGRPNGRKDENLELRGIRLPATFLPGFSQLTKFALFLRALPPSEEIAEKCRSADPIRTTPPAGCRIAQNMQHTPVDGLHSIDFSAHKNLPFLLTLKMKGVKPISFFDSF
jgi:hypothetical protein